MPSEARQEAQVRTRIIALGILCLSALVASACYRAEPTPHAQSGAQEARSTASPGTVTTSSAYQQPIRLAQLEDRAISESSGLVASRRNPGVFWTHNDSGNGPFVYAFDRAGKSVGRWRVTDAKAYDWEGIAAGPGPRPGLSYLYIGDIGDNDTERDFVTVYRVVEPSLAADDSSIGNKQYATEPAEAIRLSYPDGAHDAEALLVHPVTGDLYIVTKSLVGNSGIYKLTAPYSASAVNTLVHLQDISVRSFIGGAITGGDISPDGRRVVLCDYLGAYEMVMPENSGGEFDRIWKQPLSTIELGPRRQGETVCYRLDGMAILATSEKRPTPLIEVKRR